MIAAFLRREAVWLAVAAIAMIWIVIPGAGWLTFVLTR